LGIFRVSPLAWGSLGIPDHKYWKSLKENVNSLIEK
jgi:hypothetical protein